MYFEIIPVINGHFILGITGNIGGGKSLATDLLQNLGAQKISSDALAQYYTSESSPIRKELQDILGVEIIPNTGSIDRKAIAQKVFQDPKLLSRLAELIHPRIRLDFVEKVKSFTGGPYIIAWEIPLLFETDAFTLCDSTLTVWCSDTIALQRVKINRNWSEREYKARDGLQITIKDKIQRSEFNIENSGSKEDLQKQVQDLYTILIKKAGFK